MHIAIVEAHAYIADHDELWQIYALLLMPLLPTVCTLDLLCSGCNMHDMILICTITQAQTNTFGALVSKIYTPKMEGYGFIQSCSCFTAILQHSFHFSFSAQFYILFATHSFNIYTVTITVVTSDCIIAEYTSNILVHLKNNNSLFYSKTVKSDTNTLMLADDDKTI